VAIRPFARCQLVIQMRGVVRVRFKRLPVIVLMLGLLPLQAICWSGNFNIVQNNQSAIKDNVLGITLDYRREQWPVSVALNCFYIDHDYGYPPRDWCCGTIAQKVTVVNCGIRKLWRPDSVLQPFLGGGLSVLRGTIIESWHPAERKYAMGWWLDSGWQWTLFSRFNLGAYLRFDEADFSKENWLYGTCFAGFLFGVHL
jgi:hypothetical protein